MRRIITTECVGYGHPDKLADQISDALLTEYLKYDRGSKVAIETMVKDNIVVLGGEVTSFANINIENVVRDVYKDVHYPKSHRLRPSDIKIINLIGGQSPEINTAVFKDDEVGSGDQGIMFGYATDETKNYMPLGMYIARLITDGISKLTPDIGPDCKSQVTIEEDGDNKIIRSILISTQHDVDIELNKLREFIVRLFIDNYFKFSHNVSSLINEQTEIKINPAGSWNVGGPISDCGVTGRKIVVDQYGPYSPVGGGGFSGKDTSKTDRSAAYLARYMAKNIVASGLLKTCSIELSYIISELKPSSIRIEGSTHEGNWVIFDDELTSKIAGLFPLTPKQISNKFNLKDINYYMLAKFGHFGVDDLPWEELDKVEDLLKITK